MLYCFEFTDQYGPGRTISQKSALNKISWQEARSLADSAFKPQKRDVKKDAVPTFFNFEIGIGQKRSHSNNYPCPPKSDTTLQGNSKSVSSAFAKRRKLPSCFKLDLA